MNCIYTLQRTYTHKESVIIHLYGRKIFRCRPNSYETHSQSHTSHAHSLFFLLLSGRRETLREQVFSLSVRCALYFFFFINISLFRFRYFFQSRSFPAARLCITLLIHFLCFCCACRCVYSGRGCMGFLI